MADGGGAGLGASTGLEAATLQKLALRRKKVVGAEDMELYELAQAAGATVDPDVFKILVDLLNLNVAPLAVFQMLKSMCAGQRLARRNRDGPTLSSASTLAERGSREGSMQRIPRQPSATRLPKVGGPGKSTSRGSS
ncbi:mitotic-spindle organizing protein 2-like isoform X2 [Nannospalax galili]|uniref:mitotic-spindle organizing protein 2-like isoform X2 n=1 Tax=Nannospalax galili TaxID=1026970 RepID=UPI0004ECFD0C|nr:mitotic-spindle organizing protein 2-like isoform X2 [Nannospalax galili]